MVEQGLYRNGQERFFRPEELIVSKTDTKGRITYANRVFLRIAGYQEAEVLGKAHNIIRHPEMPRGVFKFMWERIQSGHEVFAFVKNLCKDGSFYWVLAHVTPTFDQRGEICGYHSNRRVPRREALDRIIPIYQEMAEIEADFENPKQAAAAGLQRLKMVLSQTSASCYDEFIYSIIKEARVA